MATLNSFKVLLSPILDRNASKMATSELGNDVKSEVTQATRNISLEIQGSIRKMSGAVSRGQVAGQAIFALLNRIIAKFDEMKNSVNEASASLSEMNDAAADLDSSVERVARHNLTLTDSSLSANQKAAYENYLLQVQRVMDSGSIGSGDNQRAIHFESDDVINNAIEIRKLIDQGIISLDDLGIAGKQQARLHNTFNALSTDAYEQKFNSSKFDGVNGLNAANEANYKLQDQHAVAMFLAQAQRSMQVINSDGFSMVAKTLESERESYRRISESLNPKGYDNALETQQSMEKLFGTLSTTFNNLAVHVLPPLTTALNFAVEAIGNLVERLPSVNEIGNNLGLNAYEGRNINIYDHITRNSYGSITDWGLENYSTQELKAWQEWYESLTWLQKKNVQFGNIRVGQGYDVVKKELDNRALIKELTDSSNVR